MAFDVSRFRDYQYKGICKLWEFFESIKAGNPLIAMPTASGKAWVISGFIQTVFDAWPQTRVLVATHVDILIEQNHEKLLRVWNSAPAGIYSAGLKRQDHLHPILFCGIQSVFNKAALFGKIDLLIIDEAHLVGTRDNSMYLQFIGELKKANPHLRIIGLSATCYRLGLGHLTDGGIFTHVAYDLTGVEAYNKLIADGWLCPLIPQRTERRLDISGVHMRGGDFIESQLQLAVNKKEITQAVCEEMLRAAQYRNRWLVFATGVDHAEQMSLMLNSLGVSSVPIHSKLKNSERNENYEAIRTGEVRAAVAMNALTTGVDIPEIDYIAMVRHTASTGLWVQMLGRGGRIAPWARKVNCLVSDFTDNTARLGPINDPVLPSRVGKRKGAPGPAPIKECPQCRTYSHPTVRVCPMCGFQFPEPLKFMPRSAGLDLVRNAPAPEMQLLNVSRVRYDVHTPRKKDRPPSLMVSYFCGMQRFREFVCFEHANVRWRAMMWWRMRAPRNMAPPETVEEARLQSSLLRIPVRIRVWLKQPHPEIVDHEF